MVFQALTQLQAEVDDASQLVDSIFLGKAIDVDASTKVKERLETALRTAEASVDAEELPVAVAVSRLISNLNVKSRRSITWHADRDHVNARLTFVSSLW